MLFDVLLLIRVAARDLSPAAVSLEACAAAACAKLRRRAPYVSGAAVPASPEEAEAWWQRTKEAEKAEAAKGEEPPPPPPPPPPPQPPQPPPPPPPPPTPPCPRPPLAGPEVAAWKVASARVAPAALARREKEVSAEGGEGPKAAPAVSGAASPLDGDGESDTGSLLGLSDWERDLARQSDSDEED
ncbi:hypothetical protein EMIHUDRAFT_461494 [Emiliania huxleyi CCMP1516]|uniref:WH2 domain-containing protein n=2 Tax=Emiliania huxleyi TaxID=2903 RepID=A0A0D3ITD7_EMIH1|nr:hypothetical protein EMIHUDRAFT_461494 [Emiliania huxleyi CCMP1516]EOD14522.1 hypothetical protein EMIHUDRAFT_461494 [Emiliania huxleyi CCMP1516]|eukprot:XP_005766951.1 hypothetical protein EMIHUDRAFT_461494 [Emiliania huxleyi CCMP1516]